MLIMKAGCAPSLKPPLPAPKITPEYAFTHSGLNYTELKQHTRICMYIWMRYNSFWMFPTNVDHDYMIGYIWSDGEWRYGKIIWRKIDSFFS